MSFFFTTGPSSEPTSLSSTPLQPLDDLDDSPVLSPTSQHQRAEDTTLPTTLPTSLPDTPQSHDKPMSHLESEGIYTPGPTERDIGPEDTLAFDLDLDPAGISVSRVEPYSRSPSSSGSSVSESSESSDSASSSSDDDRELSTTNSQWATLGESSHADRGEQDRDLVPGSPSAASASTILPTRPLIYREDKGKAPERPGILRTEESRYRRARSGEDKPRNRRRVVRRRRIYEDGISRDFLLIVALCIGLASAGLLIVRAVVISLFGPSPGGWDFDLNYAEWF